MIQLSISAVMVIVAGSFIIGAVATVITYLIIMKPVYEKKQKS